jgi:CHASE2 domain-containing sensor protein
LIAKKFDSLSFENLKSRQIQDDLITYHGNVDDNGESKFGFKYDALDTWEVLEESFESSRIRGKIVLFCFLGSYIGDLSFEDKYFSPLNTDVFGKTIPDMYGGVLHANIITSILEKKYIIHQSVLNWIIILTFGFVISVLFRFLYLKFPKNYHLTSKVIAFILFNLVIFLALTLFDLYRIKIEISYILLFVLFVPDGTEMVLKWIRKDLDQAFT